MGNLNEDKTVDALKYNRRLMNNVVRMPMTIDKGRDAHILDSESGKWLLDFWGDEGVCSLGYNNPEFMMAVHGFLCKGVPHQLPDVYPHEIRFEAAEIICSRTEMDRIFFANSGTEANEAAIKIARKYWFDKGQEDRIDILTIQGNFHGRTGLSLAAGDFRVSPYHRTGFGPSAQGFGVLDWWKDSGHNAVHIEKAVDNGVVVAPHVPDWSKVAAIIMAPVLGNNCVTTYPKEFWEAIVKIRKEHGVLLIYDDVQAGSGRAGYFATWQSPKIRVKPDIMTLAKGMAMGFPMSCMLASDDIAEAFTPGVHFNTFGGSPFVCHMASCLYKWLDENIEDVRQKGERIRESFSNLSWISEYDGSGLLNAFTPHYDTYGYDGYDFVHEARNHGLSLVTHRKYGAIRFTPPMNVSSKVLCLAMTALCDTHKTLASSNGGK